MSYAEQGMGEEAFAVTLSDNFSECKLGVTKRNDDSVDNGGV